MAHEDVLSMHSQKVSSDHCSRSRDAGPRRQRHTVSFVGPSLFLDHSAATARRFTTHASVRECRRGPVGMLRYKVADA
jgi:hypothetical protein